MSDIVTHDRCSDCPRLWDTEVLLCGDCPPLVVTPPKPVEAEQESKAFVKSIFPEAYLYDTKRGGFDIVDCIDKDRAMSVGYGKTEDAAWNDAARRQGFSPIAPPAPQEKIDVYEVFGSCANSRGWDFLVCRTLSNALEHIGDSLDSLEEGEEVRIIFRRYTQDQMDEVIYE